MTKNVLTKMRSWDENIGKLIVFAVTIIIAVGVLGTLAYFYNQSRDVASATAVLTSTSSSINDLKDASFCSSNPTTWSITYNPLANVYWLDCGADATSDFWTKLPTSVKWIISATCPSDMGTSTKCYKLNN